MIINSNLLQFSLKSASLIFIIAFVISFIIGTIFALGVKVKKAELILAFIQFVFAIIVTTADHLITIVIFYELISIAIVITIFLQRVNYQYAILHVFSTVMMIGGMMHHIMSTGTHLINHFQYDYSIAHLMILASLLINIGAYPFSSIMVNAYRQSSITSNIFLPIYSSKTTLFLLITMFSGTKLLQYLGIVMIFYGLIYSIFTNDIRKFLCLNIISGLGFIVTTIGIDTINAKNGAIIQIFCHIFYQQLLFLSVISIIIKTKKLTFTAWAKKSSNNINTSFISLVIALFNMLSLPFTAGFTGKATLIYESINLPFVNIGLSIASIVMIVIVAIKFLLPRFFIYNREMIRHKDNFFMQISQILLVLSCLFLGFFPQISFDLLPVKFHCHAYEANILWHQFEIISYAILAYMLLLFFKIILIEMNLAIDFANKALPFVINAKNILKKIALFHQKNLYKQIDFRIYINSLYEMKIKFKNILQTLANLNIATAAIILLALTILINIKFFITFQSI